MFELSPEDRALSEALAPLDLARGRPIRVESTKWDGSIHYQYDALLVDEVGPLLRFFAPKGTTVRGYRGEGPMQQGLVGLFFTDRWYNLYHNLGPVGRRGFLSYANVGTPAEFSDGIIRWIDLDVDVVQGEGFLSVDDEDEFAEHRELMAYPETLVQRVLETRDLLVPIASAGVFPFDRASHLPPSR